MTTTRPLNEHEPDDPLNVQHAAKVAHRLALSHRDMLGALRYIDAHDELDRMQQERGTSEFFDHCEGLLMAAIMTYCRPFKENRSVGFAAKSIHPDGLDAVKGKRALHDLILHKRDKFLAHGDWSERSTELVSAKHGEGVLRKFTVPIVRAGLDLAEFRALIEDVEQECARASVVTNLFYHAEPGAE